MAGITTVFRRSPSRREASFFPGPTLAVAKIWDDLKPVPQSGVLPYRQGEKGLEILLVTSSETGRWVPPKGNIEDGLSAQDSAAKEAFEEAGVSGKVAKRRIGRYLYRKSELKGGHLCRVDLFAMQVKKIEPEWPEMTLRHRRWMTAEEAADAVDEPLLGALITRFARSRQAG